MKTQDGRSKWPDENFPFAIVQQSIGVTEKGRRVARKRAAKEEEEAGMVV